MRKVISESLEQTGEIAREYICTLASLQKQATVVCLSGELGSGKTTFVQAFAKALGITERVTSPTFVLIKRYDIDQAQFTTLFHIDAYRLENGDELAVLGFGDLLNNPKHLICIEWPEHILGILPTKRHRISFRGITEHTREITFEDV